MLQERARKDNPPSTNYVQQQQQTNRSKLTPATNQQKATVNSVPRVSCPKPISKPPKTTNPKRCRGKRGFNQALASFDHEVRHFVSAISDPEAIASKEHEST